MPKPPILDPDDRLAQLGRSWFAEVRSKDADAAVERKRKDQSGTGDSDGDGCGDGGD